MEYLAIKKIMKEINQTMLMDWKIPYCQDISSSQLSLQIQCNLSIKILPTILWTAITSSKVYMQMQKMENSQLNTEEVKSKELLLI